MPSWTATDQAENNASRLSASDSVHLAGLVLVDVFTPSTVSALTRCYKKLPVLRDQQDELITHLKRSRSSSGLGGTVNLVFSASETFRTVFNYDPTIPLQADAAFVAVHYLMASTAVVVAIFIPKSSTSDISSLLRQDFSSESRDIKISIDGRLGKIRQRIPWARPRDFRTSATTVFADQRKRLAVQAQIGEFQHACVGWMTTRFPGRFKAEEQYDRPRAILMLTGEISPFKDYSPTLKAAGLEFGPNVWRSKDTVGWSLRQDGNMGDYRFSVTVAARRADVAVATGAGPGESSWLMVQDFLHGQSRFIAFWALGCLMDVYSDHLGNLRDRSALNRRVKKPVRQALLMDRYLIGDGLDASSLLAGLTPLTINADFLRRDTLDYAEDLSAFSPALIEGKRRRDLMPTIAEWLNQQCEQLAFETEATIGNIRASANLRQSVANTRLQRAVIVFSILALIVAIIGLLTRSGQSLRNPTLPAHTAKARPTNSGRRS